MKCGTYSTHQDYTGTVLAQCDQCHERHYFKAMYFAKNWMNAHGYNDPYLISFALRFAQD